MAGKLYGAAAEYAAAHYFGDMTENDDTATVGTAVSQVLTINPERVNLVVVNLSANIVYIAFENDVSASKGIVLTPNGGSITMNVLNDLTLVTRGIFAVASGAGSAVYWAEVVRFRGRHGEGGGDAG